MNRLTIALAAGLALIPATALAQSKISNDFKGGLKAQLEKKADSALLIATEKRDLKAMAALLAAGADPNEIVPGEGTPLIIAGRLGDLEAAKLLVSHGARLDLAVKGDGAPLIAAAAYGHDRLVTWMLRQGATIDITSPTDGSPLIKAAAAGKLSTVKLLVKNGARVDLVAPEDETALINAAQAGRLDVVKFLVEEAGADVSLGVTVRKSPKSKPQWRSPLSEARRMNHADVAAYLEGKGAIEGSM